MGGTHAILVTGFEPFGGLSENPALEVLKLLPAEVAGAAVRTVAVPVEYGRAVPCVLAEMGERPVDAVVLVGQARGRTDLTVERVAINVDDARAADNAGDVRCDEPIRADGPAAYFSTLPVRAMVEASRAAGVPADVSNSAGTYVCNHLMYGVLDEVARRGLPVKAGFVHVPLMHGQVVADPSLRGEPSMALDDIARGLGAMLEAVARGL